MVDAANLDAVLAAIALLAGSGVPAFLVPSRPVAGQRLATAFVVAGSCLGLWGALPSLGAYPEGGAPWHLAAMPLWGPLAVDIDAIGAVFLLPVFTLPALASLYGLGYWRPGQHPDRGRRLGLAFGLLAGAMAAVVIARDAVSFLIAWEVMALAAYFAATAGAEDPEVRRAGWVYLVATHLGTLGLMALFALWRQATGSFELVPASGLPADVSGALMLLALVGFGVKAGLMPLHVWLPGAHAGAPSHVSAVMSGVMLKMGVYGLVRMTGLMPSLAGHWGGILIGVGAVSALAGISFAIGQQDIKRLLAYSSIENVGIIGMGLGLAVLGRAHGRADWIAWGLGGALLHVWNHALFKGLLFLGAGAVIHASHERSLDRLGGLARRMPQVSALSILGAVAICALPPLNGFVSEWLIGLGLFATTLDVAGHTGLPAAALGAVALATAGALALACFVKLVGTVFLGEPRSEAAAGACEPPASMVLPMLGLATGCLLLGLFPAPAVRVVELVVVDWRQVQPELPMLPLPALATLSRLAQLLAVLAAAALVASRLAPRARSAATAGTWDCGYDRPTARMQYTGTSFARSLVELLRFMLWPKASRPSLRAPFSEASSCASSLPDGVLDRGLLPLFRLAGRQLPRLRVLQQGRTELYVLYVLVMLVALLVSGAFIGAGA